MSRGFPFVRGMCAPILGDAISGLFCEMLGCGIGDCRSIIDVCTNKLAEQNGREVVIVRSNVGNSFIFLKRKKFSLFIQYMRFVGRALSSISGCNVANGIVLPYNQCRLLCLKGFASAMHHCFLVYANSSSVFSMLKHWLMLGADMCLFTHIYFTSQGSSTEIMR